MNKEQSVTVVKFLEVVKNKIEEESQIMLRENFIIDNLDDRWQKLVFTFYTDILALSTEAEQILEYLKEG
ncbi:MAG: hypothetical protein ABSF21_00955 [Dehalococcoidia bacterium]